MGVSAKVFGPVAWIFIEALARYCDDFIKSHNTPLIRALTLALFLRVIYTLGFLLPCIYCRFSFRRITNTKNKWGFSLDPWSIVHQEDGCKIFVYKLRVAVNHKLENQEIDAGEQPLSVIKQKWVQYNLTYEQALTQRFMTRSVSDLFYYWTLFLGYVVCDYDSVETRRHAEQMVGAVRDLQVLISKTDTTKTFGGWTSHKMARALRKIQAYIGKDRLWADAASRSAFAWKAHVLTMQAGDWVDRIIPEEQMVMQCRVKKSCPTQEKKTQTAVI